MQKQAFIILIVLLNFLHHSGAQTILSELSKPERRGDKFFSEYAFKDALGAYQKALSNDDANAGVKLKIAETLIKLNDPTQAITYYKEGIPAQENIEADTYIKYTNALISVGDLDGAKDILDKLSLLAEKDERLAHKIEAVNMHAVLKTPKPHISVNKTKFNSTFSDFSPAFYGDQIVFASARKDDRFINTSFNWDHTNYLDLYVSDTSGQNVSRFFNSVNGIYHEGPVVFWNEGQKMMVTRNNYKGIKLSRSEKGVTNLKLFESDFVDGKWSKFKSFPFNSDEFSTGHPAINSDGTVLYFASDRPGGYGGVDIYVSYKENNVWSEPVNLGPNVNTEGDELFAFLHQDRYLYFSSDGLQGLGGLDIYLYDLNKKDLPARNLGSPINGSFDDFGIILNDDGTEGYFTSNYENGKNDDDIYMFKNPKTFVSPELKGFVFDSTNLTRMNSAEVTLYNSEGEKIHTVETDSLGNFYFEIEHDKSYTLAYGKQQYEKRSKILSDEDSKSLIELFLNKQLGVRLIGNINEQITKEPIDGVRMEFVHELDGFELVSDGNGSFSHPLSKYRINDTMDFDIKVSKPGYLTRRISFRKVITEPGDIDLSSLLKNEFSLIKLESGMDIGKFLNIKPIYFDLNNSYIRPDAADELDKLVDMLKDNPTIVIELGSHTDARGSSEYNLWLSDRRAKNSASYIKDKVDDSRIYGKGYGETRLINQCSDGIQCTEQDHQLNRRTEFRIVEF